MSSASVTLKLSPTDFTLVRESLEEAHQLLEEEVADHTVGSDEWKADNQRRIEIETLLRQLQ